MRFLIIMRGGPGALRQHAAAVGRFHRELAAAGLLLDAGGMLRPVEVRPIGGPAAQSIDRGPTSLDAAPIAGYTVIQARTCDEAREWASRVPPPAAGGPGLAIELHPLGRWPVAAER